MSARWIAGNPFLINPVLNVFDVPNQYVHGAWVFIHFAPALKI